MVQIFRFLNMYQVMCHICTTMATRQMLRRRLLQALFHQGCGVVVAFGLGAGSVLGVRCDVGFLTGVGIGSLNNVLICHTE